MKVITLGTILGWTLFLRSTPCLNGADLDEPRVSRTARLELYVEMGALGGLRRTFEIPACLGLPTV